MIRALPNTSLQTMMALANSLPAIEFVAQKDTELPSSVARPGGPVATIAPLPVSGHFPLHGRTTAQSRLRTSAADTDMKLQEGSP